MGFCNETGIKWLFSSAGSCGFPEKSSEGSETCESASDQRAFYHFGDGNRVRSTHNRCECFRSDGRRAAEIFGLNFGLGRHVESRIEILGGRVFIEHDDIFERSDPALRRIIPFLFIFYFAPHVQQLVQSINDVKRLAIVSLDRFHTTMHCLFNKKLIVQSARAFADVVQKPLQRQQTRRTVFFFLLH